MPPPVPPQRHPGALVAGSFATTVTVCALRLTQAYEKMLARPGLSGEQRAQILKMKARRETKEGGGIAEISRARAMNLVRALVTSVSPDAFATLDVNGDGYLSREEMQFGLVHTGAIFFNF